MTWDFTASNTTRNLTHGFHPYPAKMIPQVAGQIIDEYAPNAKTIFDPFCGTGTTLLEANFRGINAIGFDLNPLALLIAKSKTDVLKYETLEEYFREFHDFIYEIRFNKSRPIVTPPRFQNIDYWFGKKVQRDIEIVREFVVSIEDRKVRNFFLVALSNTIRNCSYTRNEEFKLYRMPLEKMNVFSPDVFTSMEEILARNCIGLIEYASTKNNKSTSKIFRRDSAKNISASVIKDRSIDLVLTSPPYGDSTTTVAYGQFSALANQWLFGMEQARLLDKLLMGGMRNKHPALFNSPVLNDHLTTLYKRDVNRALDVISFYSDYQSSIANISAKVKRKGMVCYVVSNRTVKGVNLPTDEITVDFFEEFGFNHIETLTRQISNKRMPKKNSPTGEAGKKKTLMNTEYIVVLQKK